MKCYTWLLFYTKRAALPSSFVTALQKEFVEEWHRFATSVEDLKGVIDVSLSKPMKDNMLFVVYAVFEDMHSFHKLIRWVGYDTC